MKKKITATAPDLGLVDAILSETPRMDLHFIDRASELAEQIHYVLEKKLGLKQKDLADKMGKSEAEISKLLSGSHNLTLKTIAAIESVLQEELFITYVGLQRKAEREGKRYHGFWSTINKHSSSYSAATKFDDTCQIVAMKNESNNIELSKAS